MNEWDIFSAIGEIDEDIIARAEIKQNHKSVAIKKAVITSVSAAAACLIVIPAVISGLNAIVSYQNLINNTPDTAPGNSVISQENLNDTEQNKSDAVSQQQEEINSMPPINDEAVESTFDVDGFTSEYYPDNNTDSDFNDNTDENDSHGYSDADSDKTPPNNSSDAFTVDNSALDNINKVFESWKSAHKIGNEVKLISASYAVETNCAYFTISKNITEYFKKDTTLKNSLTAELSAVYGTPFERTIIVTD